MADMIIPDTLPLEPCPFCGGHCQDLDDEQEDDDEK